MFSLYFPHLYSYVPYVPMWLNCIPTTVCYADCDPDNVVPVWLIIKILNRHDN